MIRRQGNSTSGRRPGAAPARPGSSRPAPARPNSAPRMAAATPRTDEGFDEAAIEIGNEEEAPARRGASGVRNVRQSGRLAAARSSTRTSSRTSRRGGDEEDDRSSRSSRAKPDNTMMIYGGVGVAVVVLLGILLMSGGSSKKPAKAPTPAAPVELGDNTPSHVWAARAEGKERSGDKLGAADDFNRAAEAADRERNMTQAKLYSNRAYQLRKFSTLNYGH